MSNHVSSEVYKRQLGSMTRKAVMALMADKASDNGTGIWASKQTMADELDTSKQTVIATIKGLIADGLLVEVGHRKCQNGYLVEYAIDVKALRRLAYVKAHAVDREDRSSTLTGQAASPVKHVDPTGQAALPDQSSSLTQTPLEPSLNQSPPTPRRGEERAGRGSAIPDDWTAPAISALPDEIGALAAQWPDGAYAAEGQAFAQHWKGSGRRKADWNAAFASRVQARHAAVLRDAKAGVTFGKTAAAGSAAAAAVVSEAAREREDQTSARLQLTLRNLVGPEIAAQWFVPAAMIFDEGGLTVVCPGRFYADWIERNHKRTLQTALQAIGRDVEFIRFIAEVAAKKGKRRG